MSASCATQTPWAGLSTSSALASNDAGTRLGGATEELSTKPMRWWHHKIRMICAFHSRYMAPASLTVTNWAKLGIDMEDDAMAPAKVEVMAPDV